ncbi:hypothetical protein OQ267_19135 [Pedobacter sp. MR22-3]|nr:hypothetical protein [Pedobacter sp. MR22-3]
MEQKLAPLQEASMIHSMKTNDATRRRSNISLIISFLALLYSVFKDKPINSLFNSGIVTASKRGYYFSYLASHPLEFVGYLFLVFFSVVSFIIIYAMLFEDLPLSNAIFQIWPFVAMLMVTSFAFAFLKVPSPLTVFFIIVISYVLAISYFVNIFFRMIKHDKYEHLKEKRVRS